MKKISLAVIFVLILGCATIKKPVMSFNECVYKCMSISRENDNDGITDSEDGQTYLMYLCGTACKEKASEEDWKRFNENFEIKSDGIII